MSFSSSHAAPSREIMPPTYKNGITTQVTFTNPKRLLSGLERTAPLVEHVEVLLIKEVTWWWRILAERIHVVAIVADVKLHLNK